MGKILDSNGTPFAFEEIEFFRFKPKSFCQRLTKEKYSHPRGEIEASMNLRMLERANSGLDLMPKSAANLALADRFLDTCASTARQYEFLEQTIFGLWASAWGRGGLLPSDEYEIIWNSCRGVKAVCRHYIGPAKNDALFVEGAPAFWWQSRRI